MQSGIDQDQAVSKDISVGLIAWTGEKVKTEVEKLEQFSRFVCCWKCLLLEIIQHTKIRSFLVNVLEIQFESEEFQDNSMRVIARLDYSPTKKEE